jgi:hypothetical protein
MNSSIWCRELKPELLEATSLIRRSISIVKDDLRWPYPIGDPLGRSNLASFLGFSPFDSDWDGKFPTSRSYIIKRQHMMGWVWDVVSDVSTEEANAWRMESINRNEPVKFSTIYESSFEPEEAVLLTQQIQQGY